MTGTQFWEVFRSARKHIILRICIALLLMAAITACLSLTYASEAWASSESPNDGQAEKPAETAAADLQKSAEAETEKLRADTMRLIEEDRQRLADAAQELEQDARRMEESRAMLDEDQRRLDEEARRLDAAAQELDNMRAQVMETERQLDSVHEELDAESRVLLNTQYQLAAMEGQRYNADEVQQARDDAQAFNADRDKWFSGGEDYLDALTELEKDKKRLEQAEQVYESDKAEYEKSLAALEEKKAEYDEEKAAYAEKTAAYNDGVKQLEQVQANLDILSAANQIEQSEPENADLAPAEEPEEQKEPEEQEEPKEQEEKPSSWHAYYTVPPLAVAALAIYAYVKRKLQERRDQNAADGESRDE